MTKEKTNINESKQNNETTDVVKQEAVANTNTDKQQTKQKAKSQPIDVTISLADHAIRWEKRDILLTRKSPSKVIKSNNPILMELIRYGLRGNVDNDILINGKPIIYYVNKMLNPKIPEKIHVRLNNNSVYLRIGNVILSKLNGNVEHVFSKSDENISIVLRAILLGQLEVVKSSNNTNDTPAISNDIEEFVKLEKTKVEIFGMVNDAFFTKEPIEKTIERIYENYGNIHDLNTMLPEIFESEKNRVLEKASDDKEKEEILRVYNEFLSFMKRRTIKE